MPSSIEPRTPSAQPRRGRLVDTLMEAAGVACLAGFFWYVWPPAPLAVAGLYLVMGGNLRAARPRPPGRKPFGERLVRALGAYLAAYRGSP